MECLFCQMCAVLLLIMTLRVCGVLLLRSVCVQGNLRQGGTTWSRQWKHLRSLIACRSRCIVCWGISLLNGIFDAHMRGAWGMRGDERALATFLSHECIMMLVYHNMPRFNDPYLYQSMYNPTSCLTTTSSEGKYHIIICWWFHHWLRYCRAWYTPRVCGKRYTHEL